MTADRVFDANGIDQRGWSRAARARWYCRVHPDGKVADMNEQYHDAPFAAGGYDPDDAYAPAWGFGDTPGDAIKAARSFLPA